MNCVQYVKDTKMQAIHNKPCVTISSKETVFNTSKIQKCKQFTTISVIPFVKNDCVQYVKDTKMQAIHNVKTIIVFELQTVFNTSKIQKCKQFTTRQV